jgi:hypothetical protein
MKQNQPNDLDVSDLPPEDVKVDDTPRHVFYTAKGHVQMIQHAYRLPLTFQPLRMKWVELIGPQSEPKQLSYTANSVWSQIALDVLSTLSRQVVKLMRYNSFCFVNKKRSSVISYHLQKTLCKNAYRDQIFRQQFGNLHPQLMSSINASYAGCWSIQSTDNIFFLYHPSMFFC